MPKKPSNNKMLNATILRYVVNFWTIILYIVIVGHYFSEDMWVEFLGPVSVIYIAALGIYSAEKEFERWHDYNLGRHPGDVYVFLWTVLVISLFIAELVSTGTYKVPSEVFTTYIVVVGILAITRKSKSKYKREVKS